MADAVRHAVAASPAVAVSQAQVDRFRLRRHLLAPRSASLSVADVAGAVNGLHAQVQSCASLMLWARSSSAALGDVERALWDSRTVVKAWFMRGTLHVMPAADLRLWGAARGLERASPAWHRYVGLTPEQVDALGDTVSEALGSGVGPMTRRELADAVGRQHGRELGDKLLSGWGMLLKPLVVRGLLIAGPPRGQETTFVRPADWLPSEPAEWEPTAARLEVLRRYLRLYGPAGRTDFQLWLGLRGGRGGDAWRAGLPELAAVSVGGRPAWCRAVDLPELVSGDPVTDEVRLLGGFDTWVLGHRDRSHLWTADLRPRISRTAGWISPVVLRGGRVVGVWSHRRAGAVVRVSVELFLPLPRRLRAGLADEAARLAEFLGGRPELETVGG